MDALDFIRNGNVTFANDFVGFRHKEVEKTFILKGMDNCDNFVIMCRNYPFHELRQEYNLISAIHGMQK